MPFELVGCPLSVASGQLACGEVQLTQTFTGSTDPYFVLFYFRPAGERVAETASVRSGSLVDPKTNEIEGPARCAKLCQATIEQMTSDAVFFAHNRALGVDAALASHDRDVMLQACAQ